MTGDYVIIAHGQVVTFWNGNTMPRDVAEERLRDASSAASIAMLVPVNLVDALDEEAWDRADARMQEEHDRQMDQEHG